MDQVQQYRSVQNMTKSQYFPLQLKRTKLVSTASFFISLNWLAFENKRYLVYDRYHENNPYGKIQTKKKPIRTLAFTSRLLCHIIITKTN